MTKFPHSPEAVPQSGYVEELRAKAALQEPLGNLPRVRLIFAVFNLTLQFLNAGRQCI